MLAVLPLLVETGWRIKIAFPHQAVAGDHELLADRIVGLDVRGIELATHHEDGTKKSQAQYRQGLAEVIDAHQPDLVWANSLSMSRLCGPVTAKLGVASVGYLRDIVKLSNKAVADVNQLDQMVAVSQATKDFHAAQGVIESKMHVIHNGVDLDLFKPVAGSGVVNVKMELGIPNDSPALLFVGQIGMRKGVDVLLDVFEKVILDLPDCHLLIVGQRHSAKQESIDYESELVMRSQRVPLQNKVHWLHRRDDMPEVYNGADLLLHPARQEPLGRVILESIACGLPVLTTLVGGSPEILGCNDSCDLLCPVDDASTMAQRAVAILQNVELRGAISEELRALALHRFDRKRCHAQTECLLANLTCKFKGKEIRREESWDVNG